MTWDDEFFESRRLTSKLKHYVLRRYVKEFAYHLGTAYHVDGFAGAGEYGTGDNREAGSPILIARLATEVATAPRSIQLRCLNVEADNERFASLEAATAPYKPHIVEHNYHSEFADAIPDILSRIGDAPTFFFLDPFVRRVSLSRNCFRSSNGKRQPTCLSHYRREALRRKQDGSRSRTRRNRVNGKRRGSRRIISRPRWTCR